MNHFWKLVACRQTTDAGAGSAGTGSGGIGSADELARVKEENARLKEAKDRAVADAAKAREKTKGIEELEAKAKRADELEARLKEYEDAKTKADATGKVLTAEDAAAMRKELSELQSFKKSSLEERAVLQREKLEAKRESILRKAVEAAGIVGQQEIEFALGSLVHSVITNEDGTFTVKYKNAEGEEIEGPVDADFVKAKAPKGLFPAKSGGGSGGRSPVTAGSGKSGDVLRDIPQAEWDKMTPEQQKVIQRQRMEAHGVRVR